MPERLAKKVLLLGWDAADWQIIDSLMARGLMPTMKSFVQGGVRGNLSTLRPVLSPMLWNSIATGKRADKHGIHGFVEPKPDGTGIQVVSSTSRKTLALWNILTLAGLRSNVVGWYASHPAEPIRGVCVSDNVMRTNKFGEPLPELSGQAVHPPSLHGRVAELRLSQADMTAAHLAPFVPSLARIPVAETGPVTSLARMLARCGTVQSVFTDLLEHEPWDFAAAYFETIDHVGHGFMHFHPPRMPGVSQEMFDRYSGVVEGIYRFHDMMLERALQLAGDDATVLVISDHGFANDHLRPTSSPQESSPDEWHRPQGIFAMRGPGVKRGETVHGAGLLDVAPTVLALLGVPLGADMEGKALAQCFDRPVKVERIPTWDAVPGDAGTHPADLRVDPFEQQSALAQLAELGYIDRPDESGERAIDLARREAQFNLAQVHLEQDRFDDAISLLEPLRAAHPAEKRYRGSLGHAYMMAGRFADARSLIERSTTPDTRTPALNMILGVIEFADGNHGQGLELLRRAERADPRLPHLHEQIGTIYLRRRQWDDALRAFAKAIDIDPGSAIAHCGVGNARLHKGDLQGAVEASLRAVDLSYELPRAHLQLGVALARLGQYDRAENAMSTAVRMRPNLLPAHRYLSKLYLRLGRADLAKRHADAARSIAALASRRPSRARLGPARLGPLTMGSDDV